MSEETVISVEGLSKKFCRSLKRSMYYGLLDTTRVMLGQPPVADGLRPSEFWALKDVSFQIRRGETVGVIGVNGAGKSTLLRLLTGIFPPDGGRISITGRVGSLIAVGAGFHPHMTGRENIYLNGAILGMTRAEIIERFTPIVRFAEIGDFLDAPVSTYSSGMRVRLGFAIAAHCDPDILLIDEVLSVGDVGFRNRSLRHLYEYKKRNNSVIFVSHQMEQIKMLCDRVIVLGDGGILFDGPALEACTRYEESENAHRLEKIRSELMGAKETDEYELRETGGDAVRFNTIGIVDPEGAELETVGLRDAIRYRCEFEVTRPVESLYFSIGINDEKYQPLIWVMNDDKRDLKFRNVSPGTYQLLVDIPNHHLVPGIYYPNVAIRNGDSGETYERAWTKSAFRIAGAPGQKERAIVHVDESWHLVPKPIATSRWDVLETLEPGEVAIDCGANVGHVSAAMALRGARVYAFEPNPEAFERLEKRFASDDSVTCINKGVLDRNDSMPLFLSDEATGDSLAWSVSSSLIAEKDNVSTDRSVEVDLIDLAAFIKELDRPVSLLKVDIEGAEFTVLNHLLDHDLLAGIRQVLVETHEERIPSLLEEKRKFSERLRERNLENVHLDWM